MSDTKRTFTTFNDRDEWMEARKNNLGASTLAGFAVTGERAKPLPQGIPALESALRFGSDWEPYIAQSIAEVNGFKIVAKNTPFDRLPDHSLSWHDNSFYSIMDGKVHASLDVAVRWNGAPYIIEIKTSSATRFAFVDKTLRDRYLLQATYEAAISGADGYIIAFAHRPTGWEDMSADDIAKQLKIDISDMTGIDTGEVLEAIENIYDQYVNPRVGDPDVQHSTLLADILDWEAKAKAGRKALAAQLAEHPGMMVSADGKVATMKESVRVVTDWKKLVEDNHIDDLTPYRTEKKSQSLSITKEKK